MGSPTMGSSSSLVFQIVPLDMFWPPLEVEWTHGGLSKARGV